MVKRSFYIHACWDEEAGVFYSESDIAGLHIEAASLEEFEAIMQDVAVELIFANHIEPEIIATRPPKEWMPFVKFDGGPERELACA